MKLILLTFVLTSFITAAHAQRLTGPGLGDEQPPTAGLDQQDDNTRKAETLSAEDTNMEHMKTKKTYNPLNEMGPKGKEAQEEARTDKFDLNKEQMKRKQKGN